jgi:site-specific DNA-methyltransferase (adenine-specific)
MVRLTLIQGDALKVLPTLPDESVDLVILDPPYLAPWQLPNLRREASSAFITERDLASIFPQLYRVMREDSDLLIFGHLPTFMRLGQRILDSGFRYCLDLVWVKPLPVNFLQAGRKPLSQHETIAVFYKGKLRFNEEGSKEKGDPYVRSRRMRGEKRRIYNVAEPCTTVNPGYRHMTDVLLAPNKPTMRRGERTEHPAQKPLELVKRLVSAFSFEGDTVLDPFLGSGTTMLACLELRRSCIGIEIEPKYIEITKRRLNWGSNLAGDVEFELIKR